MAGMFNYFNRVGDAVPTHASCSKGGTLRLSVLTPFVIALILSSGCGVEPVADLGFESASTVAIAQPSVPGSKQSNRKFEFAESPAGPASAEPFLSTTSGGTLLLSWIEKAEKGQMHLKFSELRGGKWSPSRTIVRSDKLFVNWADFPSIVEANGVLFSHWLQKSGNGKYAYDVHLSSSKDNGKTWMKSVIPHRDKTESEHGFVSLLPIPGKKSVGVVWLDGREVKGGHDAPAGAMTLRYAVIGDDGKVTNEKLIDSRVCDCCQTGATMTSSGPLVAWRDRSDNEVRDIFFARSGKGGWSIPAAVNPDNWKIAGCPVNGPQLDSSGNSSVIAWYTAAGEVPRVNAAFATSDSAFAKPVRIDQGSPLGRVDVVMVDPSNAVVVWMEKIGTQAELRVRRLSKAGSTGAPLTIARSTSARPSGFPRAVIARGALYVAWTDTESSRVKVARVGLGEI